MTLEQILLAAHQIGMVRAAKETTDPNARALWCAHNRAATELRARIGSVYQVYPYPNKAIVKALYTSLAEGLISHAEFACCLQSVMGEYR